MTNRILALISVAVFAIGSWYYLLVVFDTYFRVSRCTSDLYPRWVGARELLLRGRDPYSEEVTRSIQSGYYGDGGVDSGRDPQRFAYPLYAALFLAPTVTLPFQVVRALFIVLLAVLTSLTIPLWFRALGVPLDRGRWLMAEALLFASWPVAEGLGTQQLTLLVAFLLAAATAMVAAGRLKMAGGLLACATIKPQLALPLVAWLLLWSLSGGRRRRALALSFTLAVVALLATSEFLLKGWIVSWYRGLDLYVIYTGSRLVLQFVFGKVLGLVLTLTAVFSATIIGWRLRTSHPGTSPFGCAIALALVTTMMAVPTFNWASYNHVLFVPAAILVLTGDHSAASPVAKIIQGSALGALFWSHVTCFVVFLVACRFGASSVLREPALLVLPTMNFLFAPLAMFFAVVQRLGIDESRAPPPRGATESWGAT